MKGIERYRTALNSARNEFCLRGSSSRQKKKSYRERRGREGMIFSIKSLRGFCRGGTMDKTEIKENEWTGVSFAGKR